VTATGRQVGRRRFATNAAIAKEGCAPRRIQSLTMGANSGEAVEPQNEQASMISSSEHQEDPAKGNDQNGVVQEQEEEDHGDKKDEDELTTLWMGAIQPTWNEGFLWSLFQFTGEVVHIKLIRNQATGIPAGYAFVDFRTRNAAEGVLATLNGTQIPGTNFVFRLNWASRKPETHQGANSSELSLFVGDLSPNVDDKVLFDAFKVKYDSCVDAKVIVDVETGKTKSYGFVRFGSKTHRQRALEEMNGAKIGERCVRVGEATPRRSDSVSSVDMQNFSRLAQRPQQDHANPQLFTGIGISPPSAAAGYQFGYTATPPPPPSVQTSAGASPIPVGHLTHAMGQMSVFSSSSRSLGSTGSDSDGMLDTTTSSAVATEPCLEQEEPSDENSTNRTVFVGNLDENITEANLREHFSKQGSIESIKIPSKKSDGARCCAFIKFMSHHEAADAIQALQSSKVGKCTLRLDWGRFNMSKSRSSSFSAESSSPSSHGPYLEDMQHIMYQHAAAIGWQQPQQMYIGGTPGSPPQQFYFVYQTASPTPIAPVSPPAGYYSWIPPQQVVTPQMSDTVNEK